MSGTPFRLKTDNDIIFLKRPRESDSGLRIVYEGETFEVPAEVECTDFERKLNDLSKKIDILLEQRLRRIMGNLFREFARSFVIIISPLAPSESPKIATKELAHEIIDNSKEIYLSTGI